MLVYRKDTPRLWPRYPRVIYTYRVAMRRLAILALAATVAFAACKAGEPPSLARLDLSPVLDSIFVGDSAPARTATYYDDHGTLVGPVAPAWSSTVPGVVGVDPTTGKIAGKSRGFAVLTATYGRVQGQALVIASRQLELSLLLDTVYLMANDTFYVPVEVKKKGGGAPAPWFKSFFPSIFTIDSATGRVVGVAAGGPFKFYVHADTLVDSSGAVEVVSLTDTTGGLSYYTILGTFLRRTTVGARAVNYARAGDTLTFRLRDFITVAGQTIEAIVLTSRVSVVAPTTITIDSISPSQAFDRASGFDAICHPLSNWGLWSTRAVNPPVSALSRQGGTLVINQVKTIATGQVVSGWFSFVAQRTDVYDDPIWALPIRGTFVAPLIIDPSPCIS